ncbi:unnamed protein product [Caenorhabditis angaria]|uniref:Cadherin domain-containing protein n=1 Tax=Caenorhabditis angaria TaxID=860376 RepID=A0A9P1MYJ3_9PELO|nr:unnamed protein product [Caenorhabditis angaria]
MPSSKIQIFQVVANNSQCGNSKRIRYSMKDPKLSIDSISGTICLIQKLDYEASKTYQATVTATNSNSESSTSQISITLQDVNDNWPIFYPNEYQLTIREGLLDSNSPLLRVSATDADEAKFGEVAYQILSDSKSFTINTTSGDVFAKKPLTRGKYHLIIGAKDGSGQTSEHPANVYINVIDQETLVPMFSQSRYEIRTTEDILPGIAIGNIAAVSDGKIKYSIYSGDPQKFFAIDENSGKIYVTRYLDADIDDKVLLNIEARLEGSEMSNQTQVLIEIEDHNDNPPMFEADVLEISIREDQEINEPFYMIHAIDKDKKENGKVFYSILAIHPPNNYIEINRNSGQILTSRIFDYEQVRDYKLKLKATDGGIPAKSSNITLFIHILDVNDNPPIFSDSPEILEVVEMSPAKTIIGRIRATDRDSGENGEIKYRVTNGSEFFGVDEKLGDIYTKRPIDREVMGFIDVTVLAEDQGSPRKSSTKNFRINVLDVNDNPPSCHTISPIVVASDSGASSSIGTIVATDPDKGLNGSVLYRAQLQSNIFVVKANGEVYLKRALDSSDSPNQRLSVIVSDQGTPRKSTVCHVSIQISSSSSSSIVLFEPLQKFIEIPESCVLACRLTYFNSSGVHQWQIQSSEISNHFQIRDGVLSMLSNPQHPAPYSLTIIMSDVNGRQKSLMVKLSSSKNRKNQEVIRINERNWAIGSRVGKLGGERDPSVFYYSSNSTWCPLEVDQTSGQLYLAEKIQENIRCSFEKFNTSSGTSVKLDVDLEISRSHRSSYRPKFERDHFIVNVREDVAIGTIIASISVANMSNVEAEDQDGEVAYRFGAASLGEEKFAIDQFTGDVSVVEQLEWHVKSIYHLSIEAFTQKTTSTLLTININDIDNHPPIFISQPTIYVPSILRKGSVIHRVIAKDLDKHPKITYTFKNPSKILKINETSGEISIRTSTSVEKEQTVRVIANSSGKLAEQLISIKYSTKNQSWNYFDEQKLRINSKKFDLPTSSVEHVRLTVVSAEDFELNGLQVSVNQSSRLTILAESENHLDYTVVQADIDNDDEITEIPLLKITSTSCGVLNIPENQAFVNFRRIMVQGTSQNPLKFRFQGGNDAGFRINETSGEMSCGELDRELRQEHLLVVLVEDEQKRRSDSCTVRIIVTDINDNAPQFHPSTPDLLEINRTSNIGDILFNFDATDADIGINGKISFDLLKDESKSLDLIPETGSLVLRRFANLKTWQIVCRVFDQGYPRRLYRDVTIQIVNGAEVEASEKDQDQDQELSFLKQSYLSSVDESLPRGQFVGKIEVIPEDIGITFSIVEGNIDSAFLIDGDGVIRTNLELDKEIVEMYHLKIIGIPVQNSRHQISTRFDIRVNNLNDNLPYFSISNAVKKISESIEVGSYISTVQAKDVDQLEQLQYFLDSEEDAFNIDRFTGTIHLAKGLDFETRSRFDLKIKVTDGEFEAFSNLTLIVLDTNDNPPQFAKPIYSLCTNSLTGIDVSAIDLDSGSALTYTISPNYLAEIPDVSRGFVELKMLPPNGERHILKVVASDGKFRTAVPIVISVGEEKIEKKIRRMNREFEVDESLEPGMIVGELSETPEEQEYRMSNDFFEVDAFGRIYTRRDLRSSMVNFEVTCDDLDLKINVTIKIKPVNLNPPVFTNPIYNIALRDSMQHGQIIGKIQASDKDRDSQLSYHILSGNDLNVITINQQNGNVLFNQWNDETPERIYIEVREASRSSICELLLNLKMSGATAPFFVLPSYDVHVLEGTPINSVIFRVRSSNRLGTSSSGSQKALIYSLKDTKAFSIDVLSGEIRNKIHLDWESEPNYSMLLSVADGNGRSAVVPLKIIVEPVDEFAPIFPVKSYTFQVPLTSQIGDVIGEVRAVDEDAGIHGIVRYSILDKQNTVQVDEKGNILLLKSLSTRKNLTIEKFDILAYSSPEKSSKSTVFLEIGQFPTNPTTNLLHAKTIQIAGFVLLILMLTLIILICVCMCRGRSGGTSKEDQKSAMPSSTSMSLQKQVYSVQTGEIRNLSSDLVIGSSSLKYKYPSKFQESISSSASSEVLRAKSRSQIDSGIMDAEGSVNSSVTDYLVSIGVNGNPIPPRIRTTTTYDSLMNDYIYARVDDVLPPGPINLQTQNQHAMLRQPITTRKPPISIPSFEPLTEIFNELCEQKEYCQVEI